MWGKLILHSFRRDMRRKAVAISAVALATCLATFLLNWSLNLGDKIQRDLRAYGSNIIIVPQGESLPWISENSAATQLTGDRFLQFHEIVKLNQIFWRNQIVGLAPLFPHPVLVNNKTVLFVGTEFGERDIVSDLRKVSPYFRLRGSWPNTDTEVISGEILAKQMQWRTGQSIVLSSGNQTRTFKLIGIASSGGPEDYQLFGRLMAVQSLSGRDGQFKQLLVSALVTPTNKLYLKHERSPDSLTPQEQERYFCTPYVRSVAEDISKVFAGSEPRIVRQISQTEEKIVKKVNWLMILVTLAALVASSLTMTSTTTAMILERRKELALMKAIGSNNGFILFYLFTEILLLGAFGSLLGYAMGSLISVSLSGSIFEFAVELKWIVLPLVFFVGTLIILCGSIWPLRSAIALDPAQALKDL